MIIINAKNDGKKNKKLKFLSDEKRYSICNFVKNFLIKFNDGFCFTKEDLEEINKKVKDTKSKAKQFENVEKKLPDFFVLANDLKLQNENLLNDNLYMFGKIEELFRADLVNDVKKKKEIYIEFGFDICQVNSLVDIK